MRFTGLPSSTLLISLLSIATSIGAQPQTTRPPDAVSSSAGNIKIERLATLEFPWGMALLPDGRLLITEKPGRLRIWQNGRLSDPVQGVPSAVSRSPGEQGGLLDVEADPNFATNRLVYLSYVEADPQGLKVAETGELRFTGIDYTDSIVRGGAGARGVRAGAVLESDRFDWCRGRESNPDGPKATGF